MTNRVLVLSNSRVPLMPCSPARARELLKDGNAAVFRHFPFTIILKTRSTGDTQPVELKIDPGSKVTGFALVGYFKRGPRCVLGLNLEHRGMAIMQSLVRRSNLRHARRYRKTRYRQNRYSNRKKPKGWLPPSILHRFLTTRTWIDRFMRLLPVTLSVCEIVKFDIQLLQNPEIKGKDYQQGKLYGTEIREYLLEAYDRTCQYCSGASGIKYLEWEHKIPRSKGGSNSIENATLACTRCNQLKGSLYLKEWLAWVGNRPGSYYDALRKGIPKVMRSNKPSMRDMAVMNAVRYRIEFYLTHLGLRPQMSPGWITKRNRLDSGYPKDHWVDAVCVNKPAFITPGHQVITAKAMGRGSRQMVKTDKYGLPRGRPKGSSTVDGFKTGDLVRLNKIKGKYKGSYIDRIIIRTRGYHYIRKGTINIEATFNNFYKLQASDGYWYRTKGARVLYLSR